MKLQLTATEQIYFLSKLQDFEQEKLEKIMPDFHEKKNDLNYLKIKLCELEKASSNNNDVALNEKINHLINTLTDCQEGFKDIYLNLNRNRSKFMGLKNALDIFCNECEKKYKTEIEFDSYSIKPTNDIRGAETGLFILFSSAIELVCLQGYSAIYALLSINDGKLNLKITAKQLLKNNVSSEDVEKLLDYLNGIIIWKKASVLPETNWKDSINLELE
jgi:hypothetical protein